MPRSAMSALRQFETSLKRLKCANSGRSPDGVADGSNRPQRNRPRCEPENQRAPTEFHVDSADVRVLEFNELVSPTDDPMQVIVTPPIRKSSAG